MNLTSLDAPLVCTSWYGLLAISYKTPPSWEITWLLFSSAWVVYAMDRMFESQTSLTRPRHTFHQRHKGYFFTLIGCIVTLNCLLVWRLPLPLEIYKGGIVLGAASVAYIFQPQLPCSDQAKEWIKNLLVTFVFTSASLLPIWTSMRTTQSTMPLSFWYDATSLYLLTLASLRSIEFSENPSTSPFHWMHPTAWGVVCLLGIALFLNGSELKWTWFASAAITACVVQLFSRTTSPAPAGLYDVVLLLPAISHLGVLWIPN